MLISGGQKLRFSGSCALSEITLDQIAAATAAARHLKKATKFCFRRDACFHQQNQTSEKTLMLHLQNVQNAVMV